MASLLDSILSFGATPPQYLEGLVGQQGIEDLRKKAMTTGAFNALVGYLATPKNQNLGLGTILGNTLMAGQQGAQGVFDEATQDYVTQQKFDEMKRAKELQARRDQFIANIGKPNATRQVVSQDMVQEPVPPQEGAVAPTFQTQLPAPTVTEEKYYDPQVMLNQALQSGALDLKDYLTIAGKQKGGYKLLGTKDLEEYEKKTGFKLDTSRGQKYQVDTDTGKVYLVEGQIEPEKAKPYIGQSRETHRGDMIITETYQGEGKGKDGWVEYSKSPKWKTDAAIAAAGKLDPAQVDFYTKLELSGDKTWRSGLARDPNGRALISAVTMNIPKYAVANGLAPNELAAQYSYAKGLDKTIIDRTKYVATADQFIKNMDKQIELVRRLATKVDNTGVPLLNRWINAGRKSIAGDADITNLDTAIRGLAREHQRIVTGVTSNAQLQASAQLTADELLNKNMSIDQMLGSINVMKEEADNAKKSGIEEIQNLRESRSMINVKPQKEMIPSNTANTSLPQFDARGWKLQYKKGDKTKMYYVNPNDSTQYYEVTEKK